MSGWNKIRAYTPETLELKRVSTYVFSELSSGGTVIIYHNSTFQIDFYRFLKHMAKTHKITPNEVLCFLVRQPQYIQDIYRRNLKPLKTALLLTSKNMDRRIISFVTLYYDHYRTYGSIFRAVRQAMRYPFDKFDMPFVREVFATHPFLGTKKHLNKVLDKLAEKKYAYYITRNGVVEE